MRLWVISDLHLDVNRDRVPLAAVAADVAVIAGDLMEGTEHAIDWLARVIRPRMPVVFVAGNHEFYGSLYREEIACGRAAARAAGINLLENDCVEIGGARFVGGTMWTDFAIDGHDNVETAMMFCSRALNDHARIGWDDFVVHRFMPEHARDLHLGTRATISDVCARTFDGPTIVVTHHAPHPRSIAERFQASPVNAGFVSDLTELIQAARPALWVHGHTHNSFDYRVGTTRVVCNPHGYGAVNAGFDPGLVIEV
jgi:Icc-related predicted phosphoesterase